VDVVVQAWARVGAGNLLGARAPREELVDDVQRSADGTGVGERSEVARAVLLDAARYVDSRPRIREVDFQIRVVLVVLEADVEQGLMAFDELGLEVKGLLLGVRDD